ncbi:MAG: hypothetical protein HY966_01885 [Ignavibacteriales bacterium]|nr:hypothetical protein [Ignavibacteriales bacterium]
MVLFKWMKKPIHIRVWFAVVGLGFLFMGAVFKDRPIAYSAGNEVVVRWATLDETNIVKFEVYRSGGADKPFNYAGELKPQGNNSTYEFRDQAVFKTESGFYLYKIRSVFSDNSAIDSDVSFGVSHLSSTAVRTWGSIKAMFR